MGRVEGKVCIVTGAASGMGKADALLLAKEGAKLVLTDLNVEAGALLAAEIGEQAIFIEQDVASEDAWKAVIAATVDQFGRLDVLVNNAGMMRMTGILDCTLEEYQLLNRVNNDSVFLGCKYAIPVMAESGGGSIINISSIDGLQAKNGLSAYVSSKWAVRGLSKSAAIELGPYNIRVNTVHPGGIYTDMHGAGEGAQPSDEDNAFYVNHPLPRVGLPAEVANMSLFLASDESSYSTGSEFIVDGGWNAGLRLDLLPTS